MVKSWIFTAIDLDSILGWGTKIPQTTVVQPKIKNLGFQGGASGKEPTCQCRRHERLGFNPWVGKITWKKVTRSSILAWKNP